MYHEEKGRIPPYQYDYTRCMVMKLSLAYPKKDGSGSHVLMNFEQALTAVQAIDALTQGILKIYYLVGWQYNGHDDKYPDFFQVNPALKRPEDKTARDSFLWLYEHAKAYHSVISVHINFNDAYEDAPSFKKFCAAGALIRKRDGTPRAIERYNKKACYKTSFKEYWNSGLFQAQFDRLLDILPLTDCRTVHVDNFQCYHNCNPDISIGEMQAYRRKMIGYVTEKGIDITSEFTYREDESLPNKKFFGLPREHSPSAPMDTLGLIPASWWCTRMKREEYVTIPPQLYGGGIYKDKRYGNYLYGNMHGEDVIRIDNPDWTAAFFHDFATIQLPYHFLCQYKRLAIKGRGRNERCIFEQGIVSYNKKRKITWNGHIYKEKDTVFLPLIHREKEWIAYSGTGDSRSWVIPDKGVCAARIYRITPKGNVFLYQTQLIRGTLPITIKKREGLLIQLL